MPDRQSHTARRAVPGTPLGETARWSFLCVRCRRFQQAAAARERWVTVEHYQRGICQGCAANG